MTKMKTEEYAILFDDLERAKEEAIDNEADALMVDELDEDDDSSEPSNDPDPQASLEPIADLGTGPEY